MTGMLFKTFARQCFGPRYARLGRSLVLSGLLFAGLRMGAWRLALALGPDVDPARARSPRHRLALPATGIKKQAFPMEDPSVHWVMVRFGVMVICRPRCLRML